MKKLIQLLCAVAFLGWFAPSVQAQCTNASSFGSATINTTGTITTISTCSWAGEYSTINGAVAGQQLKFTNSAGDFITIHAGSPSGPVLGFGTSPLSISNTFTGTLYAHWNTSSACGSLNVCRTTTVQCVSCVAPPAPSNDQCGSATTIACGQTVTGSTVTATFDSAPTCGTTVDNNGSVWYKFIGNCSSVTASMCGSSYDTKLHVYTGSCGSFTCVTGNDDFCGLSSQVSFVAQQGVVYYLRVSGFGSATGNFTLNMSCAGPSIGSIANQCVTGGLVTLSGTPSGGTFSGPGVSGNTFNPAVAGVGTHTISYTVCNSSASTTVNVDPAPANDACANAIAIGCNSTTLGTTRCAGVDAGLPFCGTSGGSAGGVWYTFTGNGGYVNLNTCSPSTNYDSKLHVFTGGCGSFTCVAGNDDYFSTDLNCSTGNLASVVEFCTVAGQTYYVLVHGFSTSNGNFGLNLSCGAPLTVEAGACQTHFVGYSGPGAPDPLNYICPTISGGTAPYTTTISGSTEYICDNGCYAVSPTATTTYTVTVTDANGCSASDQVTVQVIDVVAACGSNGQPKVQICHVPPGNPNNPQQLCISPNGVPAHLAGTGIGHENCYLGPCGNTCRNTNASCQPSACAGGQYTITISGTGFLDETVGSFAGTNFGPFSFGTTNTVTVSVPSGSPSTFTLSTVGNFNDNIANYTVSCGGNVIFSGTLNGGQTVSETGICCGGQIAPKMGTTVAFGGGITVFPNPFNTSTTFKFRSNANGHSVINLYTIAGQQVATVFEGEVSVGGTYEANFNASNLAAGAYMYRYTNAEGKTTMGKVNLVK